jgi:putative membrane protein
MLFDLLISWAILSLAIWLAAAILPGVKLKTAGGVVIVAALLGILNALIGWVFWVVFTIGTFGIALLLAFLTRWVIDAILLSIIDRFSDRIEIEGFKNAFLAALLMSLFSTIAEQGLQVMGIIN